MSKSCIFECYILPRSKDLCSEFASVCNVVPESCMIRGQFNKTFTSDCRLCYKLKHSEHLLHSLLPTCRCKNSSAHLRNRPSIRPNINAECLKIAFFCRLIFKYYVAI